MAKISNSLGSPSNQYLWSTPWIWLFKFQCDQVLINVHHMTFLCIQASNNGMLWEGHQGFWISKYTYLYSDKQYDIKTTLVQHYIHMRIVLTLVSIMSCLVDFFFSFSFGHEAIGNLSCRGFKPRFTPQGARHTTRPCGVPCFVLWKNHALI